MHSVPFTDFMTAVADLKRAEVESLAAVERAEALGEECEWLEDDGEDLRAALATTRTFCAVASEATERFRCQQVHLWHVGRRLCHSWRERIEEVNRSKDALLARKRWDELREEWSYARDVVRAFPWLEDCLGPTLRAMAALRDATPN